MGFDNLTSSKYIEGGITTTPIPLRGRAFSVAVNIPDPGARKPADVATADRALARIWSSATF